MRKINKIATLAIVTPLIAVAPITTICSCSKKDTTLYKALFITEKPTKVNYLVGDKLDLSGLVVQGVLADYSTVTLTADKYTTSIADGTVLTETGTITVTVNTIDQNLSGEFKIYVNKAKITKFTITHEADKYVYNSGDRLDLTGMEVTGEFSDGTTKVLSKDEYLTFPAEGSKVYEGDKLTKNFYIYDPNDITNYELSYIIVTSSAKNFEDADWSEILQWVDFHYNPEGFTQAKADQYLAEHFNKSYLSDLIGLSHNVQINGMTYKVTIVDTNHDTIATGALAGQKALFTFRLDETISTGTSTEIEKQWNTTASNKKYTDTQLKTYVSNLATSFETSVQSVLKTVTKTTLEHDGSAYAEKTYTDSVFLPTTTELGIDSNTGGSKYSYFGTAVTRKVYKLDGDGTDYWSSTPNSTSSSSTTDSYYIGSDGAKYSYNASYTSHVAPFFCI